MIETERLLQNRDGIRFFGDVQGCFEEFHALTMDALANNLALFSLGDLIDRGPDSPACMRRAADLYAQGQFDMVPGNHDDRFVRWMQGRPVEIPKHGLGMTITQLAGDPDGKRTALRYFDMVAEAQVWRKFGGGIYAVHGAMAPDMYGRDGPLLMESVRKKQRYQALHGETNGKKNVEGYPKRTFNWVDEIPAGITVLLGHTVVSLDSILERRNDEGGRCLHLDTGLDRGGRLSYLDISRETLLSPQYVDIGSFAPAVAA